MSVREESESLKTMNNKKHNAQRAIRDHAVLIAILFKEGAWS